VADQCAVGAGRSVEEERQVGGQGQPIDLRHQDAEAALLDEGVQPGQVGFGEGGGYVHRLASRLMGGRLACSRPGFGTALSLTVRARAIQIGYLPADRQAARSGGRACRKHRKDKTTGERS
jgi:hypothetical protein